MRVSESWRHPRGIDGRQRRRFKGTPVHAKIGYGSNKKTRHMLPSGFYKFRVCNEADLELLLMHNRSYAAEVAANVSSSTRKKIVDRAAQLNIRVLNGKARLTQEEN